MEFSAVDISGLGGSSPEFVWEVSDPAMLPSDVSLASVRSSSVLQLSTLALNPAQNYAVSLTVVNPRWAVASVRAVLLFLVSDQPLPQISIEV